MQWRRRANSIEHVRRYGAQIFGEAQHGVIVFHIAPRLSRSAMATGVIGIDLELASQSVEQGQITAGVETVGMGPDQGRSGKRRRPHSIGADVYGTGRRDRERFRESTRQGRRRWDH